MTFSFNGEYDERTDAGAKKGIVTEHGLMVVSSKNKIKR